MPTFFDLPPTAATAHPARYTDALLPIMAGLLHGYSRILDPFAGTGKIFLLANWLPTAHITGLEIEPEWATLHPHTIVGNALTLPFATGAFDAVCTSPTYGNRMADHHTARDHSRKRLTYTHGLGRPLHPANSGRLQWGPAYRLFHIAAWLEVRRVLRPGGRFVLNFKDHIRAGKHRHVTDWHIQTLHDLDFTLVEHRKIACPGMRFGQNYEKRIEYESVLCWNAPRLDP